MADLQVKIAGIAFENPLIAASGTFGFGREYQEFYPLSTLGGFPARALPFRSVQVTRRPALRKRPPEC